MTSWMTAPQPIQRTAAPDSNDEAVAWFLRFMRDDGLARNTIANAGYAINTFTAWLGDLQYCDVEAPHVAQYIQEYGRKCRHHVTPTGGRNPITCRAGQSLATCPINTGKGGLHGCPGYEAIMITSLDTHLRHVKSWFNWLLSRGYVPSNPVTPEHQSWQRRKRNAISAIRSKPGKAEATVDDVRRIYLASSWRWGPIAVTMAKTGARPHEVPQLNLDREEFHEKRILRIPGDPRYGAKRTGDLPLQVDDELYRVLLGYLRHRDRYAKQNELSFFVSQHGRRFSSRNWAAAFAKSNRKTLAAAGLSGSGITPHSFRGTYTQALIDNGCPDAWRALLRGGPLPGSESQYHRAHLAAEMNTRYGPKLAIMPADVL